MAREALAQRCFNHAARPAAARCPSCQRFYCRECVTEHRGKVLCAACLAGQTSVKDRPRQSSSVLLAAGAVSGLLAAWALFYCVGGQLLRLGSDFYQVTP